MMTLENIIDQLAEAYASNDREKIYQVIKLLRTYETDEMNALKILEEIDNSVVGGITERNHKTGGYDSSTKIRSEVIENMRKFLDSLKEVNKNEN